MLYILDLGANDGCSIRKFKNEYLNNIQQYSIISYEPHPFFYERLIEENLSNKNIKIINKAISITNKRTKLYYSIRPDGSSLNKTKTTNGIDENKYFEIECDDIKEIIYNLNMKPEDKLWLKMDIEGEEYNIIPYLYENNMLKYIDRLFIEWHYNKLKNISVDTHKKCVSMINNIKTEEWDALAYAYDLNNEYTEYCKKI